ncbi:hypothetical protein IM53_008720 [Xanthomonas phaseoli pv. dieffenbachiae]|uniref:Uncharacterized protein n=1 Tax=Xanthomonas phaseoli pv. dieffenbachiae TaxID=92828 RepID=A0A1V9HBB6_9XANT|nr:hypothetical protein IM53_008720 [Xanthomonas phaseoli pv. dieffenbachiae]
MDAQQALEAVDHAGAHAGDRVARVTELGADALKQAADHVGAGPQHPRRPVGQLQVDTGPQLQKALTDAIAVAGKYADDQRPSALDGLPHAAEALLDHRQHEHERAHQQPIAFTAISCTVQLGGGGLEWRQRLPHPTIHF